MVTLPPVAVAAEATLPDAAAAAAGMFPKGSAELDSAAGGPAVNILRRKRAVLASSASTSSATRTNSSSASGTPNSPSSASFGGTDSQVFHQFSRFNRDAPTWIAVSDAVLWQLAVVLLSSHASAGGGSETKRMPLRCWSCGCSSGEEAYYLRMLWQRRLAQIFPDVDLNVIGTDLCAEKVEAARMGCYPQHSVQGLPPDWQEEFFEVPKKFTPTHGAWRSSAPLSFCSSEPDHANRERDQKISEQFEKDRAAFALAALPGSSKKRLNATSVNGGDAGRGNLWRLCDKGLRENVVFLQQDVTEDMPEGPFHVILSRYAVCLYLEADVKAQVLSSMVDRLCEGGYLVLGAKDRLPAGFCERHGLAQLEYRTKTEACPFGPSVLVEGIFQKVPAGSTALHCADASATDPRRRVPTYSAFLQADGAEPDWTVERDRLWRERTRRKLTDRSRALLERAVREGRREEGGDLLERMERDLEERQKRKAERRAEHVAKEQEVLASASQASLPQEVASEKIHRFFQRLNQDMAQRAASAKAARQEEERAASLLLRRSRSSRTILNHGTGGRRRRATSKIA